MSISLQRYSDYASYLLSDQWKAKKQEAFKAHGKVCKRCGSKKRLQVHHTSYRNLFHEEMQDLEVVCHACHKAIHAGTLAKGKPKNPRDEEAIKAWARKQSSGYKSAMRQKKKLGIR